MKIAVMGFVNVRGRRSTMASPHVTYFIYKQLQAMGEDVVLIDAVKHKQYKFEHYDVLIIMNSLFKFCNYQEIVLRIARNADRVVWCQNDHMIPLPSNFKKAGIKVDEIWSNIRLDDREYINWDELEYRKNLPYVDFSQRTGDLFYFGAYRRDRVRSFTKYLTSDLYHVHLATKPTGLQKFINLLGKDNITYYGAVTDKRQLSKFKTTVYLADKYSQSNFHSLACRFYEFLSAGVAQLIEIESAWTFQQQGLEVDERFIVASRQEIKTALKPKNSLEISMLQREMWGQVDWRKNLKKNFRKLWRRYKKKCE